MRFITCSYRPQGVPRLAGTLKAVPVEVPVLETGTEGVILPDELSALARLVIDHVHLVRVPVLIEVFLVPG